MKIPATHRETSDGPHVAPHLTHIGNTRCVIDDGETVCGVTKGTFG